MNGPDHYREAERLLRLAEGASSYAVLAQVHATLAQAAAAATLNNNLVHVHDYPFAGIDRAWATAVEKIEGAP